MSKIVGNGEVSSENLKAMVAKEKADRAGRAKAQIDAILKAERCAIIPIMVLTSGQVVGRVEIQAFD